MEEADAELTEAAQHAVEALEEHEEPASWRRGRLAAPLQVLRFRGSEVLLVMVVGVCRVTLRLPENAR